MRRRKNGPKSHDELTSRDFSDSSLPLVGGKPVVVVLQKKDMHQRLGFALERCPQTGIFSISSLEPSSPFRDSLEPGMLILSVNGLVITGREFSVALSAIRDSLGNVILGAEMHPDHAGSTSSCGWGAARPQEEKVHAPTILPRSRSWHYESVVAKCFKETEDSSLGFTLLQVPISNHSVTVVSRISPDSPLAYSGLMVGMTITAINGIDVTGHDTRDIRSLLQVMTGIIVIEAERQVPREDSPSTSHSTGTTASLTSHHSVGGSLSHGIGSITRDTSSLACSSNTHGATSISPSHHEGVWVHYTVAAIKKTPDSFLGVLIRDDPTNPETVTIAEISPDSPFRNTPLQVGDELLYVNGSCVEGLQLSYISQLLRRVVGHVQLKCRRFECMSSMEPASDGKSVGWC
eukprot:Nitzschia sp. Nitz4//scaffold97_size77645//60007//61221//NITZ4_005527-RA/size77645-processed-gene-0.97-mRNA-1//-1//CDS//3329560683//3473//frame0